MRKHYIKSRTVKLLLLPALLTFCTFLSSYGHSVDGYAANCGTGSKYIITATVSNVNTGSNYRWQYKNTSGAWVCLSNGANVIGGVSYNVTGAVSNLTVTPSALTFTNPNIGLHGLELRMVISDGAGVDPCSLPSGNTWTSTANHFIAVAGTSCGAAVNLGNYVFLDRNDNGIKDANDADWPYGGFTVKLYRDQDLNGVADAGWVTRTSGLDAASKYNFTNVPPGNYFVTLTNPYPNDWFKSTVNGGDPDNDIDNDNNAVNSLSGNTVIGGLPITLTAGGEPTTDGDGNNGNLTYDFGIWKGNGLGDFVFVDGNANGIQDAGEAGLAGVIVTLKNASGAVVATTVSDINGAYFFTDIYGLTNYTITFSSPSGYTASPANQGADDTKDSDPVGGVIANVTVPIGTWNHSFDAGFVPNSLALGNRVWNDANNNGINDGEAGIAGVTLNLYRDANNDNNADGAAIASTVTDANGYYLFSNLAAGNYIVGAVNPAGFLSSTINGGDPDNDLNLDDNGQVAVGNETRGLAITLAAGTEPDGTNTNTNTNITYDFGYYLATASIGDRVWTDVNNNGLQDAAETAGISGVIVQLKNSLGVVIATATTNASGNYLFANLPAGAYTVVFPTTVTGAVLSPANAGADDSVDSDADAATGATAVINLAAGQAITTVDAGYAPTLLALGNRVFFDQNDNGVRDAAEVGISAVTVNLYRDNDNNNVPDGPSIATTITDATGVYNFTNLTAGNYIVGATPPAGFTSSSLTGVDPDNNVDLDDNGTNLVGAEWRGLAITLLPGTENDGSVLTSNTNITYDFGFKGTGTIGNFVWNDLNHDGLQGSTEPGLAGVSVTLTYPDASTVTVVTDANGAYSFPNLPPGTYSVSFSTPASFIESPSNAGANDAIDSDPVNGVVANITLGAGETNNSIDAGFVKVITLSGNVWHDVNGLSDNLVNNSGAAQTPAASQIPVGLRAYLVNSTTGLIEKVAFVNATTGVFNFGNVVSNTGYYIILSSMQATAGNAAPPATLPTGWENTGEKLNTLTPGGTGSDGVINGRLNVPVGTVNITNANFGIRIKNGEIVIG